MIGSRLYRKQFLIAALSVFACVVVGTFLLDLIVRITMPPPEELKFPAPKIFVNFVEAESRGDYIRALEKLARYMDSDDMIRLYLLDETGKAIFPSNVVAPKVEHLPAEVHAPLPIAMGQPGTVTRLNHVPPRYLMEVARMSMGAPPAPGFEKGPGFPPRLPFGGPMMPRPAGKMGRLFFLLSFITIGFMVLAGIGLGLAIIFRSLRAAGSQADEVISELKRGNLKARFPIQRRDEIGAAMQRFNSMADEIEKLVDRLRQAENSRNNLLQELTHDLRTPVASLRTLLEGLFRSVSMNVEEREIAELAEREVEYLGKLVEDLLLLAQLSEPRFKASQGLVDILAMLEDEGDAIERKRDSKIEIKTYIHVEQVLVQGDEHLFQRLFRNALENAYAYAKNKVAVEVKETGSGFIEIKIQDDGDGFSPEELARFGERREQGSGRKTRNGKPSLGLGSVIMKSVALLHGGRIAASNATGGGAIVEILLPNKI